jgi:hypothetical protein
VHDAAGPEVERLVVRDRRQRELRVAAVDAALDQQEQDDDRGDAQRQLGLFVAVSAAPATMPGRAPRSTATASSRGRRLVEGTALLAAPLGGSGRASADAASPPAPAPAVVAVSTSERGTARSEAGGATATMRGTAGPERLRDG